MLHILFVALVIQIPESFVPSCISCSALHTQKLVQGAWVLNNIDCVSDSFFLQGVFLPTSYTTTIVKKKKKKRLVKQAQLTSEEIGLLRI